MHRFAYIVLSFALSVILSACNSATENELYVSAAVSIKDALKEVGANFEKQNPACKIVYNFAASGFLAQQILQGAPVDVFVSASEDQVSSLRKKGLVSQARDCAGNRLFVITRSKKQIKSLADLEKCENLAIGNPKTVPAGNYAAQALKKSGIYDNLISAKKLVFAEDARQILSYVEGGDVEAGIVYNTDATLAKKSRPIYEIPASMTDPIRYQIALIETSKKRKLASSFIEYVLAKEAQDLLVRRGFSR